MLETELRNGKTTVKINDYTWVEFDSITAMRYTGYNDCYIVLCGAEQYFTSQDIYNSIMSYYTSDLVGE
jgi:hypothetical protein